MTPRYEWDRAVLAGKIAGFVRDRAVLRHCGKVQRHGGQLGPGRDAELAEHVAQVEVDGARAEEQPGRDVPVGQALPDQAGDLPLLGGERRARRGVAAAGGLAGGPQLLGRGSPTEWRRGRRTPPTPPADGPGRPPAGGPGADARRRPAGCGPGRTGARRCPRARSPPRTPPRRRRHRAAPDRNLPRPVPIGRPPRRRTPPAPPPTAAPGPAGRRAPPSPGGRTRPAVSRTR